MTQTMGPNNTCSQELLLNHGAHIVYSLPQRQEGPMISRAPTKT